MAFNFGQPAASSSSGSGSLFGTAGSSGTSGGNIFGSQPSGTGSTGFAFGQAPASTSSTEPKPLFGTSTTDGKSGGLFGQAGTTSSSGGFSFPKPGENKSNEAPNNLFSGFGSQTPAKPPTSSASLFGTSTPTTGAASGSFSFGGPSTTPAGPPPALPSFGASTGGGLFGKPTQSSSEQGGFKLSQQAPPQTAPASMPSFSFNKPAEANATNPTTQPPSTPSLFGGSQPASSSSGGLFGSKPATSGATASGFSFLPPAKPAETTTASFTEAAKSPFSFPSTNSAPRSQPSVESVSNTPLFPSGPSSGPPFGAPQQSSQPPSTSGAAPATTQPQSFFSKPPTASTDSASKPTFSFPPMSASSAAPAASTTSTAPAQKPAFSFGPPASSAPASIPSFGTVTSAPSASTSATSAEPKPLFSFPSGSGSTPASQPSTTAGTTTSAPNLGGANATSGTGGLGTSTFAASTAGPVAPSQSRLRNKTMDEILTRWATDLTKYTKEFKSHAETVAKWDQLIVDNSSKIDKLYLRTRTCEKQTMSVEMQLTAVENQQNELDAWLSKYEADVEEMLARDNANQMSDLGGPDQERERTYKMADRLNERFDEMGRDLESMVEEVNAANASLSKSNKADEPITQIVRILNSHLTQLQAIDQGTAALQAKVAEAQKASSNMGYLNGNANGSGRAAVEDFYRSYTGRR